MPPLSPLSPSSPSSTTTTSAQKFELPTMSSQAQSLSSSRTCKVSVSSTSASAVAGYVAGVTGVVIGHPLDSLKVWLQTNTTGKNKHMAPGSGSVAASSSSNAGGSGGGASATTTATTNNGLRQKPSTTSMGNATRIISRGGGTAGTSAAMSTLSSAMIDQKSASRVLRSATNTTRALYSGVSGPLLSVGIVQSINFATYDSMRRVLHSRDNPNGTSDTDYLYNDSLTNVAISGFVSGMGLAFITSPLIMIKTKQQITGNGFRQALKDSLYRTNGKLNVAGCFTGFYPHLISETMGRSLYYVVYEACKRSVKSYKEHRGCVKADVTLQERMISAGFAGISCWALIYPFDVLRSRLYYEEGRYTTMEMIRTVHAEKAFYRGFLLTVLRAGPVAATVLPVYDMVLERLS